MAEKLRRERAEEEANRLPRSQVGLRSVFPAREMRRGSLDFRTIDMKVDNLWYRLVLDHLRDPHDDQEGAITLEVWRETPRLHRQVAVVGELHRLLLSWDGTIIDVSIISIPGSEKALDKHPAVFEVGTRRKAFTSNSFPMDVMRLMGREAVTGVDLSKRFLFQGEQQPGYLQRWHQPQGRAVPELRVQHRDKCVNGRSNWGLERG